MSILLAVVLIILVLVVWVAFELALIASTGVNRFIEGVVLGGSLRFSVRVFTRVEWCIETLACVLFTALLRSPFILAILAVWKWVA